MRERWHRYFNVVLAFMSTTPESSDESKHLENAEAAPTITECLSESSCNEALGAEIIEDEEEIPRIPCDFSPPDNLKFSVEYHFPVGFRRLR